MAAYSGWEVTRAIVLTGLLAMSAGSCGPAAVEPGTQRGRVIDQDTDEPIAGAIVVGRYMGGSSWGGSGCNRAESAVSDEQGWFELPVDTAAGPVLLEAYKRGYDRGYPNRIAFKRFETMWSVAVHRRNEANTRSEIVRVEPELYSSEAEAVAASGEKRNAYLRRSSVSREVRLEQLHGYQKSCAGPAKSTAGLAHLIEAILVEQEELHDDSSAIEASIRYLDSARRRAATDSAIAK